MINLNNTAERVIAEIQRRPPELALKMLDVEMFSYNRADVVEACIVRAANGVPGREEELRDYAKIQRREFGVREGRKVTVKTRVVPSLAARAHALRRDDDESNYALYHRIFEIGIAALEAVASEVQP